MVTRMRVVCVCVGKVGGWRRLKRMMMAGLLQNEGAGWLCAPTHPRDVLGVERVGHGEVRHGVRRRLRNTPRGVVSSSS